MTKKIFLSLLLLSILVIGIHCVRFLITIQQTSQAESEGKEKSQKLRQLSTQNQDGIIILTPKDYNYFILQNPRPYDFVVYFTANQCVYCNEILEEYKKLAKFYKDGGAYFPSSDGNKKFRSTFFGIVTFSEDWKPVFAELDFKSVPNILASLPKTAMLSQQERQQYLSKFKWQITHTDGHVTVHKFLEYTNKHTGRNIEYKPSLLDALTVIGALLGAATVLIGVFLLFRNFWLKPTVWFIGSVIIYVICSAGVVYNIIHGIPMTTTGKNGETEWFSSQNRSQLGAEGFVMAFSLALTGLVIIAWHKCQKVFDDDLFKKRVLYSLLFIIAYSIVTFIEEVYKKKGWYNPRFWPPDGYVKGPLMRDQGNTI